MPTETSTLRKKFEKSPRDTSELMHSSIDANTAGLTGLPEDPAAYVKLRDEGFPKIKRILRTLDAAMKKLLIDSDAPPAHLQEWNERMRSCDERIDTLHVSIPKLEENPSEWTTVIYALAWICAAVDLSKATLLHNGIDFDAIMRDAT